MHEDEKISDAYCPSSPGVTRDGNGVCEMSIKEGERFIGQLVAAVAYRAASSSSSGRLVAPTKSTQLPSASAQPSVCTISSVFSRLLASCSPALNLAMIIASGCLCHADLGYVLHTLP